MGIKAREQKQYSLAAVLSMRQVFRLEAGYDVIPMNCRLVEGDELKFPHKNARHYPEICED
jgi:hypothetical protein